MKTGVLLWCTQQPIIKQDWRLKYYIEIVMESKYTLEYNPQNFKEKKKEKTLKTYLKIQGNA